MPSKVFRTWENDFWFSRAIPLRTTRPKCDDYQQLWAPERNFFLHFSTVVTGVCISLKLINPTNAKVASTWQRIHKIDNILKASYQYSKCSKFFINTRWKSRYCCTRKILSMNLQFQEGSGDVSPFLFCPCRKRIGCHYIKDSSDSSRTIFIDWKKTISLLHSK